nr:unnamed protein product [Callosobruchus analis]
MFQMSVQSLSQIVNKMVNVLMENHSECLDKLNAVQWLNRDKLEFYAAVFRKCSLMLPLA